MWYGTVGINALTLVAQVKPEVAQQYQMVVIECLDDPDDILRRKVREDCFILVSLHLPTFTHHYHHLHLLPSSSYPLTITFTPTHHHPHIHSPSPSHPLTIVLTSTHHHPHIQSPSSSHPLTIIKSTHHHPHSHPLTITLTSTHYHPHIQSPSSSPLTITHTSTHHHPHIHSPSPSHPLTIIKSTHINQLSFLSLSPFSDNGSSLPNDQSHKRGSDHGTYAQLPPYHSRRLCKEGHCGQDHQTC